MSFTGTTIPKLPPGFSDASWSNDTCSHYEKEWNGYIIEVWIKRDDIDERECVHQYMVGIRLPEWREHIEYVEFSLNDLSEEGLRKASVRIFKKVFELMKKYS